MIPKNQQDHSMSPENRTLYIVDDNLDFLQSAQWWLEGAGYTVHATTNPQEALRLLTPPVPNACLLLDVRMPEMSGLDLHDALTARGIRLPIIYMTGHGDVPLAVQAMRKGAITFLEKPFADAALESALALAFSAPLPEPATAAPTVPSAEQAALAQRLSKLTARERQVIDLVMQSKLNKTIADMLGISIKTVELHRKNAMAKLGARSAIELTRRVITAGQVQASHA
jgi:two-component system, LuxR family, response regulator FixJ